MWLQVTNKAKVTHQGEGQINVKVKLRSFLRRDTLMQMVAFESNAFLLAFAARSLINFN